MDVVQYKNLILYPVLEKLNLLSQSAVNLMVGTLAVESNFGQYINQIDGPAKGIFQIEPTTLRDIYFSVLRYKPYLLKVVNNYKISVVSEEDNLIGNLYYSTSIARIIYYRFDDPLPPYNDLKSLARYWKKYYNTELGKGREKDFVKKYKHYVGAL